MTRPDDGLENAVAVIGLAGRYPGAPDLAAFWSLLAEGRESTRFLDDRALEAAGVPAELRRRPDWVPAASEIEDAEAFDAPFFGLSPREARTTDPQQRVFLECAWAALEDAGYDPLRAGRRTGVFAGASFNLHLASSPSLRDALFADPFAGLMGVDKDFLATRVAYKLDLRGPAVTVQTACSTSLVAAHMACQSLLSGECEMALAGGVSIRFPRGTGYLWQDGGILSPDGRCRAFDARGRGTIGGEGAGVVVLKRLDRALADGDLIRAIIRGSAVNNDGAGKVGYMAPSVTGQAEVIEEALAMAGVDPETLTCIEAHGTATSLGDPIEVEALASVFARHTDRVGFCAIGSVKTNIGHLDAAAGIASLTKAILSLENETIPPSLHFDTPNPRLAFARTPFFVPTRPVAWRRGATPRRIGVSSFGVGGTNAHLILEEAPPRSSPARAAAAEYVLPLSARTPEALAVLVARWAEHLERHPDLPAADVCFTAARGRTPFRERVAIVGRTLAEIADGLRGRRGEGVFRGTAPVEDAARGESAPARTALEAAQAFVQARPVEWTEIAGLAGGRRVPLPTYPFERHVYAAEPSRERRQLFATPGAVERTWLGRRVDSPLADAQFERELSASQPSELADHRVFGEVVVPAAFHTALLLAAARERDGAAELRDVRFPAPLRLIEASTPVVTIAADRRVHVHSRAAEGGWQRHAEASIAASAPVPAPPDVPRDGEEHAGAALFDRAEAGGAVRFGPAFRRVASYRVAAATAAGRFEPGAASDPGAPVDPGQIDGALQLLGAALSERAAGGAGGDAWLPLGIDRVWAAAAATSATEARVRVLEASEHGVSGSVWLVGAAGHTVAYLEGVHVRRAPREALDSGMPRMFEVAWVEEEPGEVAAPALWSAVVEGPQGRALVGALRAAGIEARETAAEEVRGTAPAAGVLDLRALDVAAPTPDGAAAAAARTGALLHVLRAADGRAAVVVTRGALAAADGDRPEIEVAALPGASLGAAAEAPAGRVRHVDLDPTEPVEPAAPRLARELAAAEPIVALRAGQRLVPRLSRVDAVSGPSRLEVAERGRLASLVRRALARRAPAGGEIEIEVRAAGLNFRDVLGALGRLAGPPAPLGLECAGLVTAVGADVGGLAVGDAVLALAPGSLATHVTCAAWLAVRLPPGVDLTAAASVGGAFATARAALERIAEARAGETVLVHSAASGVGAAAVAEARRLGLRVLATAGSEERRDWLRAQGLDLVLDSRTPAFADAVRDFTGGRGADIVVSALAGALIDAGLRALRPGGRFVELGKTADAAARAAQHPGVRFLPFDLGALAQQEPQTLQQLLAGIADDLACGRLGPMPRAVYSFAEARRAFRDMAAARHLGKIVLVPEAPALGVRTDAAYLVTGGLGAIGLSVAEALAARGAGAIVLAGRSEPTAAAAERLARLREAGATVRVVSADVGDRAAFETLLGNVEGLPLRGVVHAAGVAEPALLAGTDAALVRRTFGGKAAGAVHLEARAADLDFVVLLSSASAVLPRPGQSAYAAANAVLDAVAVRAQSERRRVVSLRLGPVSAGMSEREAHARETAFLDPASILDVAERALAAGSAAPVVLAADPPASEHPLLARLQKKRTGAVPPRAPAFRLPADLAPAERRRRIEQHVRTRAIEVLGLDAAHPPDPARPLGELGLDSLLALELRNTLASETGLTLASTVAFDHPTIAALAGHIDERLAPPPAARPVVPSAGSGPKGDPALENLSLDEVASLLAAELGQEDR